MLLFRKALRGVWRGKRNFVACILLIAMGIGAYVGLTLASDQLAVLVESMYRKQQFGDVFASVVGIPRENAAALSRIEGIAQVTARITADVRVLDRGDTELSLHILSFNPYEVYPLNDYLLLAGHPPTQGEIVVSQAFYEWQGLCLGDTLLLHVEGEQLRPIISGVVISPEYIDEFNGGNNGYAFMTQGDVSKIAASGVMADSLTFRLERGTRFRDVEAPLEEALERYGLKALYDRDDHYGYYRTRTSFHNLSWEAQMLSAIFLAVAMLVLYVLLRRIIQQERTQIGTLKAFGFSDSHILLMYVGYGGIIGFAGGIVGIALGFGIRNLIIGLYKDTMHMPYFTVSPDLKVLLSAILFSVAAGILGGIGGSKVTLRLSPAEAMRPAAPAAQGGRKEGNGKKKVYIRLPLTVTMAFRGMARSKARSVFVAAGMAVSFSILTFMSSYASTLEQINMDVYSYSREYDLQLTLKEARPFTQAVQDASRLPGVQGSEGMLELKAEVYHNHLHEASGIYGLEPQGSMRRLFDSSKQVYMGTPTFGALLSISLADKLNAKRGDIILMETGLTSEEKIALTVTGIVGENGGSAVYMELDTLCDILGTGKIVNTLLLESEEPAEVKDALIGAKNISSLQDMGEMRRAVAYALEQTVGANMGGLALIGLGMSVMVIVSSASMSLSERSREYATMRVLGMNVGEIGKSIFTEYLFLSLAGFLPGIPLAVGFRILIITGMHEDRVAFTTVIQPIHFVVGGVICLLTAALANISSLRHIARLDMAEALKDRG